MKKHLIATLIASIFVPTVVFAASPIESITKEWTYSHVNSGVAGQIAKISAYDAITNTIWVAGIVGVNVLNATNGS